MLRKKNKLAGLAVLLLISLTLTACGENKKNEESVPVDSKANSTVEIDGKEYNQTTTKDGATMISPK